MFLLNKRDIDKTKENILSELQMLEGTTKVFQVVYSDKTQICTLFFRTLSCED